MTRLHRKRLTAQLLAGAPAGDVRAVVRRLLAVQGQDQRGARLAVRARSTGCSAHDVDRALTEERSLIITWLNRGTLHLVGSDDYPWLHALTTPQLRTANMHRLQQEGVSAHLAERGLTTIERSLEREGPLTREQLRDVIASADVPVGGQALVHLLFLAALRGMAVRGPMVGLRHAYVLVRDWLPPSPRVDRESALAELASRYLEGHGPATDRDLAQWAGVTLRDARAAMNSIARHLVDEGEGRVDLAARPEPEATRPRLLGAFDPVLLGWTSRTAVLAGNAGRVVAGGMFRPFALVQGRAAGTWTLDRRGVRLDLFAPMTRATQLALEADATDVTRYLGIAQGTGQRVRTGAASMEPATAMRRTNASPHTPSHEGGDP